MNEKPNKIRNTRIVTFKEDYFSQIGLKEKAEPIYRKGSTHAINITLVALLKDKGAKFDIKEFDYDGAVRRAKVQLQKNRDKEAKMAYA